MQASRTGSAHAHVDRDRPKVEREVLDVVGGLVAELGSGRGRSVSATQSLDRDLGLGSLERVELLLRLEQAFGIRLPDEAMVQADTPADLADAILRAEGAPVDVAPPPAEP